MAGLFSRIKQWDRKEKLTAVDLNLEFNNVITKSTPTYIDDISSTVTDMRNTSDPGDVGEEDQAQSFKEEIEQLRFMIKSITAGAQWYSSPENSIETLFSFFSVPTRRIFSGRVDAYGQPVFLKPDGSSLRVSLLASETPLQAFIANDLVVFDSDLTITDLSAAPTTNNTCLVNLSDMAGQTYSKLIGEGDFSIPIDTIGSNINAIGGTRQSFKIVHGGSTEYFTAEVDITNSVLKNAVRGHFFDSNEANKPRIAIHNNDVITLLKTAHVFATDETPRELLVTYVQPAVAFREPTGTDFWFDLQNNTWKRVVSGSFASVRAVYLGYCITDGTACIAARSADFFRQFSRANGFKLERVGDKEVCSKEDFAIVSSYGRKFQLASRSQKWDMANNLDTGVTEAASTTYFFYLTHEGERVISDVSPQDRFHDLFGAYHPAKPWRCIGSIFNNSSSNFNAIGASESRIDSSLHFEEENGSFRVTQDGSNRTLQLTTPDGSDPSPLCPIYANIPFQNDITYSSIVKKFEAPMSVAYTTTTFRELDAFGIGLTFTNIALQVFLGFKSERLFLDVDSITNHTTSALPRPEGRLFSPRNLNLFSGDANCVSLGTIVDESPDLAVFRSLNVRAARNGNITMVFGPVGGGIFHGSSLTRVRRFHDSNNFYIIDNLGTIGYVHSSASQGTTLFVLRSGIWSIAYQDANSGGAGLVALTTIYSNVFTNYYTDSFYDGDRLGSSQLATGKTGYVKFEGFLGKGERVYPVDLGTNDLTSAKLYIGYLGDSPR